jgi:RNA polymerase sigma-70 factor (ECF subfamily)
MRAETLQRNVVTPANASAHHRFTMLFKDARPAVQRYATYLCRYTGDPTTTAQDLVQDALSVAWKRFDDLREGVQFKTWMYSIMNRTYSNYSRAEQRHRCTTIAQAESEETIDVAHESTPYQLIMEMRQALLRLDAKDREALLLFTLGGLSVDELSALQKCGVDAMKKRLERARKKMRSLLDDQGKGGATPTFSEDILSETFKLLDAALTRRPQ